jgi:hypothetical protein
MNVTLPLQFCHPGMPFSTLLRPAGHPQIGLKFWSVDWSVGRTVDHRVSHTNVTLPLQFHCPGTPFPTFLRPAGHPQNGLKFWSIGRLAGQGEVTPMSRCLFSFVTQARPSKPLYTLQATPKTALNFGRSVGGSVGWSRGSHECYAASSVSSPGHALPDSSTPCGPPQNWP